MSRILIETYRGWEIYFDTASEDFYTISNQYDTDKVKRTFASTKKYIDDYIKENEVFISVWIQKSESVFGNLNRVKLIGMRKDKAFMCEDKDGKRRQISSYEETEYFLSDDRNDVHFEELEKLDKEIATIQDKMKLIKQKLIKVDLKEYKKTLLGE